MSYVLLVPMLLICLAVVGFLLLIGRTLAKLVADGRNFESLYPYDWNAQGAAPGISIVVPIKGPAAGLNRAVTSLLEQDYPGALEIIFAFQDASDPSLPEIKTLLQTFSASPIKTKILAGLPFLGLNPKNSNLVYGFRETLHPWIFFCDVDTRFPPNHLKRCVQMTRVDGNRYVTALTVHDGARVLPAWMEMLGTNMAMFPMFVLTYRYDKNPGPINGAANFFSKELLARAGGVESILNVITDDGEFERRFKSVGGRGALAPHFARTTLRTQSWKGFFQRQFRWMMIAKAYFYPACLITPLLWVWQWLIVLGLIFQRPEVWGAGVFVLICRVVAFAYFQTLMDVPVRDKMKSPAILLCDVIVPFLWIGSLPKRRVVWGGRALIVQAGGTLTLEKS